MGGFVWYPGKQQLVSRSFEAALVDTARDILDDLNESGTIPHAGRAVRPGRRAGLLQESGKIEPMPTTSGTCRIVYDTEFARSVYYHPKWSFSTSVNPHPQGMWFEPYKSGGHKANLAHDAYMRRLRQHGRGWLF